MRFIYPVLSDTVWFSRTRYGKPLMCIGLYRFCVHHQLAGKCTWRCNKQSKGSFEAADAIKFTKTKYGNPTISWGNFRFIKKLRRGMKTWWECSARKSSGCKCVANQYSGYLNVVISWYKSVNGASTNTPAGGPKSVGPVSRRNPVVPRL
ncbi:unnamed protein product [Colias eurytheme]|nr:unnamed protein product [Colias eurytheme]